MRAAILALLAGLTLAPATGVSRPFPPGRCTDLDDGVDPSAASAQSILSLDAISMELPREAPATAGGFDNALIADVAFSVRPDGSVSAVKVLCMRPFDANYSRALAAAAAHWTFRPPADHAVRTAYRVIAGGRPARTTWLGWLQSAPPARTKARPGA